MLKIEDAILELTWPGTIGNQKKHRLLELLKAMDAELQAYRASGLTPDELTRAAELVKADKEGRCVRLPEVSEQDRKGMADFLHDCFADWTHDPSVGLWGMTDGEAALANAIIAALTRAEAEAEAALGGGDANN